VHSLPLIGITMGDPAGVGPEIIVSALADEHPYRFCRPIVLGDPEIIKAAVLLSGRDMTLNQISNPLEAVSRPGVLDVMVLSGLKKGSIPPGKPTVEGGRAMVEYIIRAVEMALRGELAAMVTCPINKALMNRAGYSYEGHTQLIAHLTDIDDYVMMLAGDRLRVALASIHCALRDVPQILDREVVHRTISITARSLVTDFGLTSPRIAVAALNPHAGESGMFGEEETEIIGPAVKRAVEEGLNAEGPLPADTLFYRAASGEFDVVIAMYHDQGLIPLKLLHFSNAVNVTLGLPIIRTSVDHGTAYDIAGTGQADASSLKAAIRMASEMVRNRSARSG
jgi:4-hydroxythreonine-4-phosphate dehydrogenase